MKPPARERKYERWSEIDAAIDGGGARFRAGAAAHTRDRRLGKVEEIVRRDEDGKVIVFVFFRGRPHRSGGKGGTVTGGWVPRGTDAYEQAIYPGDLFVTEDHVLPAESVEAGA